MSLGYRAVQWSPQKRAYDLVAAGLVVGYVVSFLAVARLTPGGRGVSDPILLMRALGTCALLLLHIILCIGPLARLDRRFLPLLYNRRHLGVMTFLLGAGHALLALGFYHGFGSVAPPVSLLTSSAQYRSLSAFPFETLGLVALLILFLMAATSHDFWLKNLTPCAWKGLHMLVYVAWALLVLHVALGALQSERALLYPMLLGAGVVVVSSLHVVAACRERARDRVARRWPPAEAWIDVGAVDDIRPDRAKVVGLRGGQRVAVFRYDGKVSALGNVCAHQGGPLGEGKVVGGCVTCPWHGYQYRPGDGRAPPPFTEKVPTYRVRVLAGRILLHPQPLAPGTAVDAAPEEEAHA